MSDRTCVLCCAPIVGRPKTARYCTVRCRKLAELALRAPRFSLVCAVCELSFRATKPARFCSVACEAFSKARKSSPLRWRQCSTCGWWRTRETGCPKRAEHARIGPGPCDSCGGTIAGRSDKRYCSKRCRNREASARRRAKTRRDQWRTDRTQGRVRRFAIYERDGWKCQLCGKRARRSAVVPDPLAPVLDHIVPVSMGGEHVEANLQLAHHGCNSKKRAGTGPRGDQLRLDLHAA